MKPLAAHADVWTEFDEAAAYYESKRPGLGREFRLAVEEAFEWIRHHPELCSRHRGTRYRKRFVKRFPYTVYFLERDNDIWLAAVAHQSRRPGYWRGRTPDEE